jgi:hypothetical protein
MRTVLLLVMTLATASGCVANALPDSPAVSCGVPDKPLCDGDARCQPGYTVYLNETCVPCGGAGERCCKPSRGEYVFTCDDGLTCDLDKGVCD